MAQSYGEMGAVGIAGYKDSISCQLLLRVEA